MRFELILLLFIRVYEIIKNKVVVKFFFLNYPFNIFINGHHQSQHQHLLETLGRIGYQL
jgi:hypothetical protein